MVGVRSGKEAVDHSGRAQGLGFERMCDLLNVNPAHRHQAIDDGDTNLQGIAYLSQLEDSSSGYGDDWGAGGQITAPATQQ